jgi:hypothetical protein
VGGSAWSDGIRAFVAGSPVFAMALAAGTLIIQCGAFLFPWTARTRAIWGALFVSFHVGIHLVAGSIFFLQAVFLTVLFALPWPAVLARAGAPRPPPEPAEAPAPRDRLRRVNMAAAAVLVFLLALGAAPLRPRVHPIELARPPAGAARETSTDSLGPLAVGMELGGGWRVETLVVQRDGAVVTLARADQALVFDVTARAEAPRGHFDKGGLHVLYRETSLPFDALRPAGEALASLLAEAAGEREPAAAFVDWLEEAR